MLLFSKDALNVIKSDKVISNVTRVLFEINAVLLNSIYQRNLKTYSAVFNFMLIIQLF